MAPVLRCAWQMKNHHQTKKCSYKILRVGTHYATRVAATCGRDFLQRQIASCVLETFCENLCGCNRILSPQQVAQCFFFLRLVAATKFCRRDKDFKKVSSTHEAICRSDIWVQLVARPVHTEWSVANLSHSVFTSSSFSYSAPGARDGPGRRGPWEWGRKHTRVSLIKTKSNCPEKFKITIILQVPICLLAFGDQVGNGL